MTDVKTTEAPKTEAPKAPEVTKVAKVTKKQQATELFDEMLAKREKGDFETNRDFRQACIQLFQDELEVSGSSACTMYNVNRKAAMAADPTLTLGRDPKKEKPKKKEPVATPKEAPVVKADVIIDTQPEEELTPPASDEPIDYFGEEDEDFQTAVQEEIAAELDREEKELAEAE